MTTTTSLLPTDFVKGDPASMTFFGKPLAAYGTADLQHIICWQHNQWVNQMQQNRTRMANLIGCDK
jgi:hypothetical protein